MVLYLCYNFRACVRRSCIYLNYSLPLIIGGINKCFESSGRNTVCHQNLIIHLLLFCIEYWLFPPFSSPPQNLHKFLFLCPAIHPKYLFNVYCKQINLNFRSSEVSLDFYLPMTTYLLSVVFLWNLFTLILKLVNIRD